MKRVFRLVNKNRKHFSRVHLPKMSHKSSLIEICCITTNIQLLSNEDDIKLLKKEMHFEKFNFNM